MRLVSVRDFRSQSSRIWRELSQEKEMVVTLNGRPVAILSQVPGNRVEETLAAIRTARAVQAVELIQRESVKKGLNKLTLDEINAEIKKVREERSR